MIPVRSSRLTDKIVNSSTMDRYKKRAIFQGISLFSYVIHCERQGRVQEILKQLELKSF